MSALTALYPHGKGSTADRDATFFSWADYPVARQIFETVAIMTNDNLAHDSVGAFE